MLLCAPKKCPKRPFLVNQKSYLTVTKYAQDKSREPQWLFMTLLAHFFYDTMTLAVIEKRQNK